MKKGLALFMLITALAALTITPVFAHTQEAPMKKTFNAGSPHYYGEPGPKDPDWYYDHLTKVGEVQVWNDGTNLHITYDTNTWEVSGWTLRETHLAIADDFEGIPQTHSGNPKVGKFPYKHEDLGGVELDEYVIPLTDLGLTVGDQIVIAAHGVVMGPCGQEETAWADCGGPDAFFPGGNWATFFTYVIQ